MKLFFDFDSTFIQTETLDQLALMQNITSVEGITHQAMEGKLSFHEALVKRLACLNVDEKFFPSLIERLPVSVSVRRHQDWFLKNSEHIYIISGGLKEIIVPIVSPFGIKESHVFANNFMNGKLNESNPLAHAYGKSQVIESLVIPHERSILIGDGYTDLQVRKDGKVTQFYAYVENLNWKQGLSGINWFSIGSKHESIGKNIHSTSLYKSGQEFLYIASTAHFCKVMIFFSISSL